MHSLLPFTHAAGVYCSSQLYKRARQLKMGGLTTVEVTLEWPPTKGEKRTLAELGFSA